MPCRAEKPAYSAMLIGPLRFLTETSPVATFQIMRTVSADMSQVFATAAAGRGNRRRSARRVRMLSGTCRGRSRGCTPMRPIMRPPSRWASTSIGTTKRSSPALDVERQRLARARLHRSAPAPGNPRPARRRPRRSRRPRAAQRCAAGLSGHDLADRRSGSSGTRNRTPGRGSSAPGSVSARRSSGDHAQIDAALAAGAVRAAHAQLDRRVVHEPVEDGEHCAFARRAIGSPPTATISVARARDRRAPRRARPSPRRSPASAPARPPRTAPSTRRTANRKLANGPASSTRIRRQTGLRLYACVQLRRGATGPSRSSSSLT